MTDHRSAYVYDAVRTPFGRYGGALAGTRPDDLAAETLKAVVERTGVDPAAIGLAALQHLRIFAETEPVDGRVGEVHRAAAFLAHEDLVFGPVFQCRPDVESIAHAR